MTLEEKQKEVRLGRKRRESAAKTKWEKVHLYSEREGKHCVYLMGNAEFEWYKIGVSYRPESRLKELSVVPFDLSLLHVEPVSHSFPFTMKVERALHKFYKENKIKGEWFTSIELESFKKEAKRLVREIGL